MGEFNFNDILNEDEISALFEDESTESSQVTPPEEMEEKQEETTTEVDVDDVFNDEDSSESPESVGSEENNQDGEGTASQQKAVSPNFYSSIAKALNEDGTLPDLDKDTLDKIKTAEDFAEAIETQVRAKLDEKQRRIDEALGVGIEPTAIQQYERTIDYLDSITVDAINDESNKGETLRKQLIYQDFINRGYTKERAVREVTKSFNAGSDIEDAKEALQSNKDFFNDSYNKMIKEAKDEETKRAETQKKEAEALKKSILDDEKFFGDLVVDKNQRKKIFESISKPVYRTSDGDYLTEIQKYEQDNHNDFMKYVGLFYTLTDGFKNFDGLVKNKVKKEMKKGLKNLESTLNNSMRNSDGDLSFVTSRRSDEDDSYIGKGGWVLDM